MATPVSGELLARLEAKASEVRKAFEDGELSGAELAGISALYVPEHYVKGWKSKSADEVRQQFPGGCCNLAAPALKLCLDMDQQFGPDASEVVAGSYGRDDGYDGEYDYGPRPHTFIRMTHPALRGVIADITADQFNDLRYGIFNNDGPHRYTPAPNVYVGPLIDPWSYEAAYLG